MDTSETYIRMCEKAGEIQANHRWEYGEWLIAEHGVFQIGTASFHYDMGDGSKPPIRSDLPVATIQAEDLDSALFTGEIIWLPRQDQLQEMRGFYEDKLWLDTLCQFFDFMYEKSTNKLDENLYEWLPIPKFTSMEQLWLAFLFAGKYGKYWDGSDWVEQK